MKIDVWTGFEDDFAMVPMLKGAKCAHINLTFITPDGEKIEIGLTREGYTALLEEFEDEPS